MLAALIPPLPRYWIIALATSLLLAACSGGGGGGGSSSSSGNSFTVSATSLSFNSTQNGALPPAQDIQTSFSNPEAYYVGAAYPPGVSPVSWLTITQSGSGNAYTFHFSVNTTSLSPGTYSTTVGLGIARQDGSIIDYENVDISYTVKAKLTASPSALNFTYVIGNPVPPDTNIDVGGTNVTWTASANQSWVDLGNTSGVAPDTLGIGFNPSGLSVGTYSATLTISGAGAADTVTVPITLVVEAPALQPSQTTLSFSGVNGSTLPPQAVTISMNNTYTATWTATSGASWLVLDKTSGTTPETLTVSVNPAITPLGNGTYDSTITLSGSANGLTLNTIINVSLTLSAPSFTMNPGSIALGGSDGNDMSSRTFQLSLNTDNNAYNWNASTTDSWIQISPSSGSVSATPSTVTITPNSVGLSGGIYNGSVAFTATVNGSQVIRNLPVTLRLNTHRLFVQDDGVALLSSPTLKKLTHTVTVRDNRAQPTPWTATSSQSWLSVTPSGITSGPLVLTANATGLATETIHYANVVISSADPTIVNSGQEIIRVGLYVTTVPPAEPAVATLVNPAKRTGIVADPVRPYVYVTNGGAGIDIYNIYTGALVNTITSPTSDLRTLAISSDGSRLYALDHVNLGIVVADLTTTPPTVISTWSNPVWSSCTTCTDPNLAPDLDYTRINGRPFLIPSGREVIDAQTGASMVGSGSGLSFFMFSSLDEISGDGKTLFTANTNSAGHTVSSYILHYSDADDSVTVTLAHSSSKSGYARGLSTDYHGSRVYRACWYPDQIEVYDGATLSTLSTITSGTNGGALLGPDGFVYCSRYYSELTAPGVPDVWAYNPATSSVVAGRQYNVLGEIAERQLVISGDGLRLITRSNNLTTLTSTSISP